MPSPECAFCGIDPEDQRVIKRGKFFTSLLSNPRLAEGHALVVPNRHVECITELSSGEGFDVFDEARRIANLLLGHVRGVDTWTKTRPEMPETETKVNHVHMHVIPSNPGDELYATGLVWTPDRFQPLSDSERDAMVDLLIDRPTD